MDNMLEKLRKRAEEKVLNTAPISVFKQVHPKQRDARKEKIKQLIDKTTVADVLNWLKHDPDASVVVGLIVKEIEKRKLNGEEISQEQNDILEGTWKTQK